MIASAISSADQAGETNAEPKPSRPTTSPPALRVRASIFARVSASRNFATGMPAIWQELRTGTMSSPWPPSTMALTLSTDTLAASATK